MNPTVSTIAVDTHSVVKLDSSAVDNISLRGTEIKEGEVGKGRGEKVGIGKGNGVGLSIGAGVGKGCG